VHPYATLAWGIVSSAYKVSRQRNDYLIFSDRDVQIVRNQVTTDQKLIALVRTMEKVYSFVDAIESNVSEKVKALEDIIKRIFAQTMECSIFIKQYAKQGGFASKTP